MKTILWCILTICASATLRAQAPSWEWVKQNSGSGLATANMIVPSPENGFYLTGRFADSVRFGNHSLVNSGHDKVEFYLARFNEQGTCLWMRHIGGANPFSIFSGAYNFYMAADEQGNVYAEASADTLFLGDTTLVGPSNFLIKFNKAGDRLFVRKIPVAGLIAIQGSRVYLAGGVGVTVQFDNISLPSLGSSDAFVFVLDTNGAVQWGKRMGTSRFEDCQAIVVDSNQNIFICGRYTDSTEFDGIKLVGSTQLESYLTKLNSTGAVQWALTGGSNRMQLMPSGKIALAVSPAAIRMYNADGTLDWSRSIGNAEITALAVGPDGKLNMSFVKQDSVSFPPYLFTKPSTGFYPGVLGVVQTDSLGNLLWAKGAPTADLSYDRIPSITCDTAGAILIAGQASTRTALDGYIISNPMQFSAFFAKTGAVTVLPDINGSRLASGITLSPNPTTSRTSVHWKGAYSSMQIMEATGRVVRESPLKPVQTSADVSLQNLSPGLYYIRLQGPSGSAVGRVVLRP